MGNKRMIDGDIASSASLNAVCRDARLTFVHLLTLADPYGRFVFVPRVLLAACFPLDDDVSASHLGGWIDELVREGCLHRYEDNGREYCHFPKWEVYQNLRRRGDSKLPVPTPLTCQHCSGEVAGLLREGSGSDAGEVPPEVEVEVEVEGEVEVEVSQGVHAPASPPRKKDPPPAWAHELAELLVQFVQGVPGGTVAPGATGRWAKEIVALVRDTPDLDFTGGFTDCVPQIEAGIRWLFSDQNAGEFAIVVRSGRALREKWPRIVAQAQRQHERSPEGKQARSDAVWDQLRQDSEFY